MTFREKYEQEYADKIANDNEKFPYYGCPGEYYNDPESAGDMCPNCVGDEFHIGCVKCWEREMPETAEKVSDGLKKILPGSIDEMHDVPHDMQFVTSKKPNEPDPLEEQFRYMLWLLGKYGVNWTLRYNAKANSFTLTMKDKKEK